MKDFRGPDCLDAEDYHLKDTHSRNDHNFDLLDQIKHGIFLSEKTGPKCMTPVQIDKKSPAQSAHEALLKMHLKKRCQETPDEYIYKTAFPEIKDKYSFVYDESESVGLDGYKEWEVYKSKFGRTDTRDSAELMKELNLTTKRLRDEFLKRQVMDNSHAGTPASNCKDAKDAKDAKESSCGDIGTCSYGRVYDDLVIRKFDSELFIGLHEIARLMDDTGFIDAKKLYDIDTFFIIDGSGMQVRALNIPGEGIWQVDILRNGITFTPFSTITKNPEKIHFEARNYETRELFNSTLEYHNRKFPVTIDVTVSDFDINPDTIQLINPRSNRPSMKFAVEGEGVWFIDNFNHVIFEPDEALIGNPTEIMYMAHTNQDEYAGTARIKIDFGLEPSPGIDIAPDHAG